MTTDTIFDVASLTKVVATATSIMILVQRGKVRLNDPVSRHIPELKGEGRERVTIEQLLTHVSGYAPDFDLRERWTGHDEAIKRLIVEPLRNPPGTRFTYSDIGFIALGEVVGRVSGMPLDQFAKENIFEPLKMRDTGSVRMQVCSRGLHRPKNVAGSSVIWVTLRRTLVRKATFGCAARYTTQLHIA